MSKRPEPHILVCDSAPNFLKAVTQGCPHDLWQVETAQSGTEVLEKCRHKRPDLIVIDLMMPHVHGLAIIKTLQANQPSHPICAILTAYPVMLQNQQVAIEAGADYLLWKPLNVDHLWELIDSYLQHGNLPPFPVPPPLAQPDAQRYCYHPSPSILTSYLRFWGTRGSSPVSGARYVRYGGNTSCVEIQTQDDLVILDAGSGIRELGQQIDTTKTKMIHLFLSHTHWDHIIGFPFFPPLYQENSQITVWAPAGFGQSTKKLFTNMLAYAYFPVRLDEMKAQVFFKELHDGEPISIGSITLDFHFTYHPGPTVGFKITFPHKTIGYITDNEMLFNYHGHPNSIHRKHPLLEPHLTLIDFLQGCDLIVHEAQYFPAEYAEKVGWGHSSIPNATVLVKYIDCPSWIITHHDPRHTDQMLQVKHGLHQDILKECGLDIQTEMAYDGLMIPV